MRIAVTGASGFIGGRIATALADEGHRVIGLGRKPHGWLHENGRYVSADLSAADARPLVEGADAVIHAAATTDDTAPLTEALAINRDAVAALHARFPGARVVHISSSSVYAADRPTLGLREDEPPARRFLSGYAASKAAGERALAASPAGADAIVLRPHGVYGRGDRTLMPRFEGLVRGGLLPLPGGARSLHTLTGVHNLVDAVRLALRPAAPAGVYNIADAGAVMLDEVVLEAMRRRGHADIRILAVPTRAALHAARAFERAAAAGILGTPPLTRYAIHSVADPKTLDIAKAKRMLGYDPTATDVSDAADW